MSSVQMEDGQKTGVRWSARGFSNRHASAYRHRAASNSPPATRPPTQRCRPAIGKTVNGALECRPVVSSLSEHSEHSEHSHRLAARTPARTDTQLARLRRRRCHAHGFGGVKARQTCFSPPLGVVPCPRSRRGALPSDKVHAVALPYTPQPAWSDSACMGRVTRLIEKTVETSIGASLSCLRNRQDAFYLLAAHSSTAAGVQAGAQRTSPLDLPLDFPDAGPRAGCGSSDVAAYRSRSAAACNVR